MCDRKRWVTYKWLVNFIIWTVIITVFILFSYSAIPCKAKVSCYSPIRTTVKGTNLRTQMDHSSSQRKQLLTSDNEVSFNGLHQCQGVDLHRAALPLLHISAVWVSLQLTLELMCIEELQSLRAPGARHFETCKKCTPNNVTALNIE